MIEAIERAIIGATEERLSVPVVTDLFKVYRVAGGVEALAGLIARMPEANREPLIHTLGSHVTKEKPVFVYAVGEALGVSQVRAATLSAVVDMLWALSLIVDDIEDDDTVRAGRESAWVKFGKQSALDLLNLDYRQFRRDWGSSLVGVGGW